MRFQRNMSLLLENRGMSTLEVHGGAELTALVEKP
jgi:hypothetical protein